MNSVQKAIFVGSKEEGGIWEILTDIVDLKNVSRSDALFLLKSEIDFILGSDDIYLIKSEGLYDSESCELMDKENLLSLALSDVEFKESGPFYYLSNVPEI